MHGFVMVAVYDRDHEPDFTNRLSNKLLDIPVLNERQVAEVVKKAMSAPYVG